MDSSATDGSPWNAASWPVMLCLLVVSVYCLTCAVQLYPIPNVDSSFFVGTAIRFAQGHGLTHPVWTYRALDVTGQDRVVTYPPLFFWLVGALMPRPDARWAFAIIAVFRIVQVTTWAWIFSRLLDWCGVRGDTRHVWLVVLLLLAIVSEAGGPMEGRPEVLVALLHAITIVLVIRLDPRWHPVVLGVALGLVGAAHPVGAIMSAGVIACYAGCRWTFVAATWRLTVIGVLSIVVFAVILWLGPNGLIPTLKGTMSVVDEIIIPAWGSLRVLLWAGRTPFSGFMLAAAFMSGVVLTFRHRTAIRSMPVLVAGAALFWFAVWYFSIRPPDRIYNAMIFTPILLGLVVAACAGERGPRVVRAAPWLLAGACTIGFARYVILLSFFLRSGVTYREAKALVAKELSLGANPRISVPHDGMVLVDDFTRLSFNNRIPEALAEHPPIVAFLRTLDPGQVAALRAAGYERHSALVGPAVPRGFPEWSGGYTIEVYRSDVAR